MTLAFSLCGPRHPPIVLADTADARAGKDPTRTYYLRARMRAEGDRRWQLLARTIRQALIEHDLLGLKGIGRLAHGDKAEGFAAWLRGELNHKVYGYDGSWLRSYVKQAADTAQKRAHQLAPAGQHDPSRADSMETLAVSELKGIVETAQQRITRSVTQSLMANASPTATANSVAGVIHQMRQRTRAMAEWMIAKTHATVTLSAFRNARVQQVGIIPEHRRKRRLHDAGEGKVLKQSVNYRTHMGYQACGNCAMYHSVREFLGTCDLVEGPIDPTYYCDEYMAKAKDAADARRAVSGPVSRSSREKTPSPAVIAAVERVQTQLERKFPDEVDTLTAGDEDVCPECEEISDSGPYTLNEAEGLIPAHPWCRCAFVPAGSLGDAAPASQAAGVIFKTKTGHMLLMKRADTGEWSIPAGHLEKNETPRHAMHRESAEETGNPGNHRAYKVHEQTTRGVRFHTYVQPAEWQFEPILNPEHTQHGWFKPPNLPKPLHPGLAAAMHAMTEGGPTPYAATDEAPGHPFRGNQYKEGESGGGKEKGGKGPPRVFTGQQVNTRTKLSKLETGAIGEQVVTNVMKQAGIEDARSLNLQGNNYPIDLVGDHIAVEVKTGLVSNGRSAQQWRATIGQPGPKEAAWLAKASDKQKAAWNEKKAQAILDRKNAALRDLSKQAGGKVKGMTVGVILNPDTRTADVHVFQGFHSRIAWGSAEAQASYFKTVRYGKKA